MVKNLLNWRGVLFFLGLLGFLGCLPGGGDSTQWVVQSPPSLSPSLRDPLTESYSAALGFAQLGNTCFANSVHKLLWAAVDFPDSETVPKDQEAKKLYFSLMNQLSENWEQLQKDPKGAGIQGHGFEDPLNKFFDALNDWNLKPDHHGSKNIDLLHIPSKVREDQVDALAYLSNLDDILDLKSLIGGYYFSKNITFKDGTVQPVVIKTPDQKNFTLPIPLDSALHSSSPFFINLLAHYFKTQDSDGPIKRDDNGKKELAQITDQLTLDSPDEIPHQILMVLNEKNFAVKHSDKISLDFYQNLNPAHLLVEKKPYSLRGVVVHRGSDGAGHYVAYIQKEKNHWVLHNDLHVTPIEFGRESQMWQDIDQGGYLFLYKE